MSRSAIGLCRRHKLRTRCCLHGPHSAPEVGSNILPLLKVPPFLLGPPPRQATATLP